MKKLSTAPLFLAAYSAAAFGAAAQAAFYPGKVEGIALEKSKSVYNYSDGTVFKDGLALPEGEGENERVKRVALFYLWLDRDPFFLAPAGDMAGMDRTLPKLAALENRALGLVKTPEKLYPVGFLSAYAEASGSFEGFAASPSEAGAAAVLAKIRLAVTEYSAGAGKIAASYAKFYDLRGLDRLAGPGGGGVTNKATVMGDFDLIKKNGAAAAERLDELAKCLEESSSYCRPEWPALRSPPPQLRPSTPIFKPAKLGLAKWPVSGPYLLRAPCWHGQADNYFYYHERCEAEGLCIDWDYLATDMLFRPNEMDMELKEKGLKLDPMNGSTLYTCGAKEYVPVLRAMAYFERDYGSRPVFDGAELPALPAAAAAGVEAVKKAERDYFAEKVKSQASFERLGKAYMEALKELDGFDLPVEAGLRGRGRLSTLHTVNFSYTLGRIVFHVRHHVRRLSKIKNLPEPEFNLSGMFLVRSFYSLMFMPFSPTVWRIPERPSYIYSMETVSDGKTLHYSEAVKAYGQEEVDKSVKFYSELPDGRRRLAPE